MLVMKKPPPQSNRLMEVFLKGVYWVLCFAYSLLLIFLLVYIQKLSHLKTT